LSKCVKNFNNFVHRDRRILFAILKILNFEFLKIIIAGIIFNVRNWSCNEPKMQKKNINTNVQFLTSSKFKICQKFIISQSKVINCTCVVIFAWLVLNFWQIFNIKLDQKAIEAYFFIYVSNVQLKITKSIVLNVDLVTFAGCLA
jgi:hypothetical protein